MRIAVDPTATPPVRLLERDVLTAFDVAVPAGTSVADLAAVLGPVGDLDAEGGDVTAAHVRVPIGWLRETAHAEGADAGWDERFGRMLAFAASKGWVVDGTVRAHVVVERTG